MVTLYESIFEEIQFRLIERKYNFFVPQKAMNCSSFSFLINDRFIDIDLNRLVVTRNKHKHVIDITDPNFIKSIVDTIVSLANDKTDT